MLGKKLINSGPAGSGANTFASENFNTVLYTGTGSAQSIGGYINRGAVFNGSNSTIILPNTEPFGASNTIKSISAWIRLNDITSNTTDNAWIYSVSSNDTYDWFYVGYRPTQNKIQVYRRASSTNYAQTDATITPDTNWHHVLVQLTSTEVEIYLDGTKLTTTNTNSGTGSNTSWINYANFSGTIVSQIGKSRVTVPKYYDGKIDQVRFFNKALSSSEVTTLYGETFASTTKSTTDIFNDNSGVALYQLDGNANDTGGVGGKFEGSAAHFNGSANITTSLDFSNLTDYTISMWLFAASAPPNTEFFAGTIQNSGALNGIYLAVETDGDIRFYERNASASTTTLISTDSITFDSWNHIVAVRDGSTNYLYINNGTPVSASNSTITHAIDFTLGRAGAYTTRPVVGKIDDVRIYSDVLTSTEVGYLYNNTTASIPTANLEAYYKLDGDARDEQQLHDGTATNVTYAYDGTASNVTYQEATKFTPDLVWIKDRDTNYAHQLYDTVRGETKKLHSNTTAAEATDSTGLTSFDSNGFTISTNVGINTNNNDYATWCFKGGGAAVSNTDGTITSSVSANTGAGFSIVELNKPNLNTDTFGHGLSSAPEMVILKRTASADDWYVYHKDLGNTVRISLNSNAAKVTGTGVWGSTTPTSSVFTLQNQNGGDHIAYCFHSVDGYSKVGSYTGTGASGNLVETGFEPAFLMIKSSSNSEPWFLLDNKRDPVNPRDNRLMADSSAAEDDGSVHTVDFLSNGFELNGTVGNGTNGNNVSYIYLAIAADPDETTPTVEDSFDVVTYTGNGSTQEIATDFKPDLVWIKSRDSSAFNLLFDSVRGFNFLSSNTSSAEDTTNVVTLSSYNSNGFTTGNDNGTINGSGDSLVAWCWKAGDHDDNLPQINTNGTIDSTVSVNDAAGFSIVKFTGTGANATVGHGLSSAPKIIFVKILDSSDNWMVLSTDVGATKKAHLNASNAFDTDSAAWNDTAPTSTVFSVGTKNGTNKSGDNFIAYCWTSVTGHSKIGTYSGNSTSGRLINTGFAARWVMIKTTNATSNWFILDKQRGGTKDLRANASNAEETRTNGVTFVDNGFEIDDTSVGFNSTGTTYIYMAFK